MAISIIKKGKSVKVECYPTFVSFEGILLSSNTTVNSTWHNTFIHYKIKANDNNKIYEVTVKPNRLPQVFEIK